VVGDQPEANTTIRIATTNRTIEETKVLPPRRRPYFAAEIRPKPGKTYQRYTPGRSL
jgi:hypothetical protein